VSLWRRFIEAVFLVAVSVWVGAIVLLSFVVAPGLFSALSRDQAGEVMNQLFPVYYELGALCASVALVIGGLQAYLGRRWGTVRFWLTGVMFVATLYGGFVVTPQAQALRTQLQTEDARTLEGGERASLKAAFDRHHRRAVIANGIALLSGLGVLWVMGIAERRTGHEQSVRRFSLPGAGR
jgi:hypothetical protein